VSPVKVGRQVLARAAAKSGGVEALAERMQIGHRVLRHYIEGKEPVPDEVLLRALDVLLDEGGPKKAQK
jgi:hypothetical protein